MEPNLTISALREVWQQSSEQHWLPVIGISMLPLLHQGDEILVSHDLSILHKGDILVFQKVDGLVAHRVLKIVKQPGKLNSYLTKGDNRWSFDAPLLESEVLGRVTTIRKNGGKLKSISPGSLSWNSILASYHLMIGSLYQIFQSIKVKIYK